MGRNPEEAFARPGKFSHPTFRTIFFLLLTPVFVSFFLHLEAGESSAQKALPNAKALIDIALTVKINGLEIAIKGDGLIQDYQSFRLEDPPRLVVDFPNMMNATGKKQIRVSSSLLSDIRIGQHDQKVRIVFIFPGAKIPSYQTSWDGPTLKFFLVQPAKGEKAPEKKAAVIAVPKPEKPSPTPADAPKAAAQTPTVPSLLPMEKPVAKKTEPPQEIKKETAAEGKMPVTAVPQKPAQTPEAEPKTSAKTADLPLPRPPESTPIRIVGVPPEVKKEAKTEEGIKGTNAPQKREAPAGTGLDKSRAAAYKGKKVSLDVKDADIRNVLRQISEASGRKIIAGEDVQGKVTIRLTDVPWDQALDIILDYYHWKKTEEGNIIRISAGD